ncbi:hypothetical protein ECG_07372 [Echinococcus granulosus]|uniref:Uncharacterized protein n=1 Tax=Echinococcus granulosus TaxID=6210 RepID=W6V039_ECHGR|nr:hypothetical protein EGR_05813 [Echinococcus granulosus]EUB59329.1 hypothetical protein EGR_05813 [Echinococcus granulosus]KAH9280670.1 hypothetical protein ECG_07372 [Echinococcus granulosus]
MDSEIMEGENGKKGNIRSKENDIEGEVGSWRLSKFALEKAHAETMEENSENSVDIAGEGKSEQLMEIVVSNRVNLGSQVVGDKSVKLNEAISGEGEKEVQDETNSKFVEIVDFNHNEVAPFVEEEDNFVVGPALLCEIEVSPEETVAQNHFVLSENWKQIESPLVEVAKIENHNKVKSTDNAPVGVVTEALEEVYTKLQL